MEQVPVLFGIVLAVLGSILLVILIVLGLKAINIMNKVDKMVDDINSKMRRIDGVFTLVDTATDRLANVSDVLINSITGLIKRLFNKKRKDDEDE